jgi:hypothetical protein
MLTVALEFIWQVGPQLRGLMMESSVKWVI